MRRMVGVDVGGSACKTVLLSSDGSVLEERVFATNGHEGLAAFTERLATSIEPWLLGPKAPETVGVAVAGLVDENGVVVDAPNLRAFEGWRVADELSPRLGGVIVEAENDVNAMAYGELSLGTAKGVSNAIFLALGTGVGGAIIIDGKLYRGTHGVAGELGHVTLQVDGPECSCGQAGHVESYLGAKGIAILAGSRLDAVGEEEKEPLLAACREEGELSTRAVALAAEKGDPLSISILEDVGRLLGLVCAGFVNVFNPELVVIGGGVALCGDLLLGPARKSMKERAMTASRRGVKLVAAKLGLSAAATGVAILAFHAQSDHGETEF